MTRNKKLSNGIENGLLTVLYLIIILGIIWPGISLLLWEILTLDLG